MNTTERELLERCKEALIELPFDSGTLIKDIEAYLAKPIEAPCNLDGLAKLGWQAVECSICGSHAMAYPKPVQEPSCNPHPNAPHGFNRNASHSANRYVCECEGWSEKENCD